MEKFGGRGFWLFVRSGSESYTGSSNTTPYPYRRTAAFAVEKRARVNWEFCTSAWVRLN
jgi:hypothetical protein